MLVKFIWLIMLFGLLSSTSVADSGQMCHVPDALNGKDLILSVDEEYSFNSPEVIGLMQYSFDINSFVNYIIQDNYIFPGKYTYQRIDSDLGLISVFEVMGDMISKYQILLVCISDIQGYFIYSLEYGERMPNVKHDTGFYILRE